MGFFFPKSRDRKKISKWRRTLKDKTNPDNKFKSSLGRKLEQYQEDLLDNPLTL